MANKALAKRQKMTIRVEPSQRPLKSRNAVVGDAKQKAAQSPASTRSGRSIQARLLSKVFGKTGKQ